MSEETPEKLLQLMVASRFCHRPEKCGTIYYIGCPETKRLKIGFTNSNPVARLRSLQTGSPTELRLMAMHPGFIEDERYLHDFFDGNRIHGEWFEMDEYLFTHLAFVCWIAAVDARYRNVDTPQWAQVGLEAIEQHYGPFPTDIGGSLQ